MRAKNYAKVIKMKSDSLIYWVLYFAVAILVAWVAFSLILIWLKPVLYKADGSINWWTTLWVAALVMLFSWLLVIVLAFIISLFTGGRVYYPDPADVTSY
jgi:hypothetical protein